SRLRKPLTTVDTYGYLWRTLVLANVVNAPRSLRAPRRRPPMSPQTHPKRGRRLVRRALLAALAALLPVAALFVAQAMPAHAATLNLTQYVNPIIGTDDSNSPNPVGGGAGGSTYPGAVVPFGGVQFSPDTPSASPSGYRDSDRTIEEFSLTHFDGAGCPNDEDIGILPITGNVSPSPGTNWTSFASGYTKSNEQAVPG